MARGTTSRPFLVKTAEAWLISSPACQVWFGSRVSGRGRRDAPSFGVGEEKVRLVRLQSVGESHSPPSSDSMLGEAFDLLSHFKHSEKLGPELTLSEGDSVLENTCHYASVRVFAVCRAVSILWRDPAPGRNRAAVYSLHPAEYCRNFHTQKIPNRFLNRKPQSATRADIWRPVFSG